MARKIPTAVALAAALATFVTSPHSRAAAAMQFAPEPPGNITPPVTDEQILRAAQDIERAEAAVVRFRQREAELAERLLDASEELERLAVAHAQAAGESERRAEEERQWARALQSAQERTREVQWQVQRQRRELDSLRLQQRLMFAAAWVRLELRPAGAQVHAMWLRNTSTGGSIRVTYREPVVAGGPVHAARVRMLAAGEEINLGTRRAGDRIVYEAAVLGAEWVRGFPPPGTPQVSSADIREAELILLHLEQEAGAALARERAAGEEHRGAQRSLRAARAAEAPHERALAGHRRLIERMTRDRQLAAAHLREAQRSLATALAYLERLLKRKQDQDSPKAGP
jgi:hypothetical protein